MVSRMARIVHMGKLGGYAALLDGKLLELGRFLWPSVSAVGEAVRRAGIVPSDMIVDTRLPDAARPVAPVIAYAIASVVAAVSAPAAATSRRGGLPLAA